MDVGDQLRWLQDATDDGGRRLNWRDARRNRIVFFAHPGACAACASYARELLDVGDSLARWDGDIWLIGGIADGTAPSATDVVRVTGDADRRLRERCGLAPEDARVIVAAGGARSGRPRSPTTATSSSTRATCSRPPSSSRSSARNVRRSTSRPATGAASADTPAAVELSVPTSALHAS